MPVKYIDEKTLEILDNDAVKASGAPIAYGIKSVEELLESSLAKDASFSIYGANL